MQQKAQSRIGGKKVQGTIPAYQEYVLNELIDIEGTSLSDVVSRVIGNWIHDHKDYLEGLGISEEVWLKQLDEIVLAKDNKVIDYISHKKRHED